MSGAKWGKNRRRERRSRRSPTSPHKAGVGYRLRSWRSTCWPQRRAVLLHGVDLSQPGRDLLRGAGLAAVIGGSGLEPLGFRPARAMAVSAVLRGSALSAKIVRDLPRILTLNPAR